MKTIRDRRLGCVPWFICGVLVLAVLLFVLCGPSIQEIRDRIQEERLNGIVYVGPGSASWTENHPEPSEARNEPESQNTSDTPTYIYVPGGGDDLEYHNFAFISLDSLQAFAEELKRDEDAAASPFTPFFHQRVSPGDADNPQLQNMAKSMAAEMAAAMKKVPKPLEDKFLSEGKAVLIPPGNYKIDGYYDQSGNETTLRFISNTWYAADGNGAYFKIFRDNKVYYVAAETH